MPFRFLVHLVLALAIAGPTLVAYNVSPSATLLNQLLSLAGWGLVLAAVPVPGLSPTAHEQPLWLALVVLFVAIGWAQQEGLSSPLAWSALALLAAGAAVAWHGLNAATRRDGALVRAFHQAMLLAGLASVVVALLQVLAPTAADGSFIAHSGLPGRAVGNLRQPNHLSSLLMWALVEWVPLAQASQLARQREKVLALGIAGLLMWAVVLTASRTGIVGVVLLALWGLVDKRLARWVRIALVSAPVAYALIALAMSGWAHTTGHTFGGEGRLAEGDVSASRFGIWANTIEMIRQQPWTGVGFGEFNFAWTLTPFPGRPVAFFDHTHNLPLQLWVELGIPLGSLVLGLLLWALVQAGVRSWRVPGEEGAGSRAAFMMVLMIGVHSLFEYPLWYAYFLLPTAWAWGYALRLPEAAKPKHELPAPRFGAPLLLRLAGVLMIVGSLYALYDYWKVVAIYAPTDDAGPLPERIERGQGSLFFSHHADYAAATTTTPPSAAMAAFGTTTHSLLDTRLMLAWAQALAESGNRDKASYLAARLREFRNPASAEFFEVCNDPDKMAASPPPFQCVPPPAGLTWRDFQAHTE
ncbi:Wzy polymerase domain-containing protein [Ideonella sp.]|uniref:PglL family O-oligosaccharyltransferase n=1 Tax=Ideonella sp. TaxID=1929293 RepID=UPI0035B190BB